jgi:hypothetical protein
MLFSSSPSNNKSSAIARLFHRSNFFVKSWIKSIFGLTLCDYTSGGSGRGRESMQQLDIEEIVEQ